jgi:hypothetical protein
LRLAGRMLMILTPSEPSVTNTTTTTPFARRPTAISRFLYLARRWIGEVETIVLGDVGKALRFVPDDLHNIYCIYNLSGSMAFAFMRATRRRACMLFWACMNRIRKLTSAKPVTRRHRRMRNSALSTAISPAKL